GAPAIVVISRSGFSARLVSSYRPSMPVFAVTTQESTFRQLAAVWGVHPVLAEDVDVTYEELSRVGRQAVVASGVGERGASVAITAGFPFQKSGSTNNMRLDRL
ncbi:MAG: pyruvate kinase alpha/beta domain-containing protein, partial [Longimicrobiales bacterium]|nr:pyruvate kinase alpha/beta domain-containing protein [Longimicrobiales bacterium]